MSCFAETVQIQGSVMNKPAGLRKGQAFREYLVVRDRVQEMINKGFDLRSIHQKLLASEDITMSYFALYHNHFRKLRKTQRRKSRVEAQNIQPAALPQVSVSQGSPPPVPAIRPLPPASAPGLGKGSPETNNGSATSNKLKMAMEESQKEEQQYLDRISSGPEL
jgi:hypothetical protein